MRAGEEVSRTGAAGRFMEEQSIRTDGVKAVMFHDNFFSKNGAEEERAKRGTGQVDQVRPPEQVSQLHEVRLAHDPEPKI